MGGRPARHEEPADRPRLPRPRFQGAYWLCAEPLNLSSPHKRNAASAQACGSCGRFWRGMASIRAAIRQHLPEGLEGRAVRRGWRLTPAVHLALRLFSPAGRNRYACASSLLSRPKQAVPPRSFRSGGLRRRSCSRRVAAAPHVVGGRQPPAPSSSARKISIFRRLFKFPRPCRRPDYSVSRLRVLFLLRERVWCAEMMPNGATALMLRRDSCQKWQLILY